MRLDNLHEWEEYDDWSGMGVQDPTPTFGELHYYDLIKRQNRLIGAITGFLEIFPSLMAATYDKKTEPQQPKPVPAINDRWMKAARKGIPGAVKAVQTLQNPPLFSDKWPNVPPISSLIQILLLPRSLGFEQHKRFGGVFGGRWIKHLDGGLIAIMRYQTSDAHDMFSGKGFFESEEKSAERRWFDVSIARVGRETLPIFHRQINLDEDGFYIPIRGNDRLGEVSWSFISEEELKHTIESLLEEAVDPAYSDLPGMGRESMVDILGPLQFGSSGMFSRVFTRAINNHVGFVAYQQKRGSIKIILRADGEDIDSQEFPIRHPDVRSMIAQFMRDSIRKVE